MSIGAIASQAFVPNKLAGLTLWLDASDLATISESGGFVSFWRDKGVEQNSVAQPTDTFQPRTEVDTINGLNVLTFDGVNDRLFRATFTEGAISQINTIYVVWETISLPATIGKLIDGTTSGQRHAIDAVRVTSNDEWAMFAGNVLTGDPKSVGVPYLATTSYRGSGNAEGYINGLLEITGDVGADSFNGITIGSGFDSTNFLHAKVGEIIVKDGFSQLLERLAVEKYLSDKWGI